MPLIEPVNLAGKFLREKILLIGPGKAGKSSCWLSIAWWAHQSGDKRRFFVMDTDQAVYDVMNDPDFGLELTPKAQKRLRAAMRSTRKGIPLAEAKRRKRA